MEVVVDEFEILWFVVSEIGYIEHEPEDESEGAKDPAKQVEYPLPGFRIEFGGGHGF